MLKTHESHFRNFTGMKTLPTVLWFAAASLPLAIIIGMMVYLSY